MKARAERDHDARDARATAQRRTAPAARIHNDTGAHAAAARALNTSPRSRELQAWRQTLDRRPAVVTQAQRTADANQPIQAQWDWLSGLGSGLWSGLSSAGSALLAHPYLSAAGALGVGLAGWYGYDYARTPTTELANLEAARETDDPLLGRLLDEALTAGARHRVPVRYGRDPLGSHNRATGPRASQRRYAITIDPAQFPDPLVRESIILHELTHTVADQAYPINENTPGTSAWNVQGGSDETTQADLMFLLTEIGALDAAVESDRAALGPHYAHLRDRTDRMANQSQEFDSVASELYYYSVRAGVPRDTDTFRQIERMAKGAYVSRQTGGRLQDSLARLAQFNLRTNRFLAPARVVGGRRVGARAARHD